MYRFLKRKQRVLLGTLMVVLSFSFMSIQRVLPVQDPEICISAEEQRLYQLIMNYRKLKKLPPIKISAALTKVAQTHAYDLSVNKPNDARECNMHSWSSKGSWTSCCYDRKHTQSECMWKKPKEIAGFNADGFEVVYGSMDESFQATPDAALAAWKKSPPHHAVIVNTDIWKNRTWKAIGLGVYKNYICVWFAATEDPSVPSLCEQSKD